MYGQLSHDAYLIKKKLNIQYVAIPFIVEQNLIMENLK